MAKGPTRRRRPDRPISRQAAGRRWDATTSDFSGHVTLERPALTPHTAQRLAAVALSNIARDYPHKLDHVLTCDEDAAPPRTLHPAFHGSYDWHSCVHMHWLLARLSRRFPDLPARSSIEALFDRHLSPVARNDPQLVHLDGLNLSRAWCFGGIAGALPDGDPRIAVARAAGERHLVAGWQGLTNESFVGAHWLGTFALLALEG
jgi:hypothetical protein